MEKKILLGKNIAQKSSPEKTEEIISGPICPLPGIKSDTVYKGGALTSAFMSAFL